MTEEIDMMSRQLEKAGFIVDLSYRNEMRRWHSHLAGDGCFAGTDKETHAYLRGALAIYNRGDET